MILVFEDLQWADTGLLDFIEYLLEWSRNHPIFVLALSRPELAERRPALRLGRPEPDTISLEPLSAASMERLLDGFVPGLPGELRAQILSRAEGVPLYAVETVRMLLDRGLLAREGDVYRPTGEIESLDVPETLHALVSARLDGLAPDERRLLQDAAVLGKSFTKAGLAALSGMPDAEIERLVTSLVRKEVLSVQADPRSPERGQYSFLQDLLKRVAYETLAKQERKARHLAAAAHLAQAYGAGEQEIVEVIAAHYVDAYRAAPDADDATEIKALAQQMLTRAGERAASLAANDEAEHYFERAAELSDDLAARGGAARACRRDCVGLRPCERARVHLERAIELFEAEGLTHPAARVSARLGVVEWRSTQLDQALERMERAFEILSGDEPDEDLATLAAELGRLHFFRGDLELAERRIETAVEIAEFLWLPEVLVAGAQHPGADRELGRPLGAIARPLEARAPARARARSLRRRRCGRTTTLATCSTAATGTRRRSRFIERGVALARKAGDRMQGWRLAARAAWCLQRVGRWDEALAYSREIPADHRLWTLSELNAEVEIAAARGDLEVAMRVIDEMSPLDESADVQEREAFFAARRFYYRGGRPLRRGIRGRAGSAGASAPGYGLESRSMRRSRTPRRSSRRSHSAGSTRVEELIGRIEAIPPGFGRRPCGRRRRGSRLSCARRGASTRRPSRASRPPRRSSASMVSSSRSRSRSSSTASGSSRRAGPRTPKHCCARRARRSSGWKRRRTLPARTPWAPASPRSTDPAAPADLAVAPAARRFRSRVPRERDAPAVDCRRCCRSSPRLRSRRNSSSPVSGRAAVGSRAADRGPQARDFAEFGWASRTVVVNRARCGARLASGRARGSGDRRVARAPRGGARCTWAGTARAGADREP